MVRYRDIYICMDDSGKIDKNNKICVFCGLCFLDQKEFDKFRSVYQKQIDNIKCKYCNGIECLFGGECPEIKSNLLYSYENKYRKGLFESKQGISDRRILLNLIKSHYKYGVVVDISKVYPNILANPSSTNRYRDYVQKIVIKGIFEDLIKQGIILNTENIHLHLFLDEQQTNTDGNYTLDKSIYEEFVHGIINFNYATTFRPILKGKFKITLKYRDSKYNYDVQAADILAGTVRHILVDESYSLYDRYTKLDSILDLVVKLP